MHLKVSSASIFPLLKTSLSLLPKRVYATFEKNLTVKTVLPANGLYFAFF